MAVSILSDLPVVGSLPVSSLRFSGRENGEERRGKRNGGAGGELFRPLIPTLTLYMLADRPSGVGFTPKDTEIVSGQFKTDIGRTRSVKKIKMLKNGASVSSWRILARPSSSAF